VTVSSKTDDDPCDDAVRTALEALHDEDEIVYMRDPYEPTLDDMSVGPTFNKAPGSPPHEIPAATIFPSPPAHKPSSPVTPRFGPIGPSSVEDKSPGRRHDAHVLPPPQVGTTALDLLKALQQSPGSLGRSHHTRGQSASQLPSFLGSGAIDGATRSIWSPSHESTSLMTSGMGDVAHQSLLPHYQLQQHTSLLNHSQPLPPSFPTQSSQSYSQGAAPAASLPPHLFNPMGGGHHRRLSHPDFNALPPTQNPPYDPFNSFVPAAELHNSQYNIGVPSLYPDALFPQNGPSYQQPLAYQEELLPVHHDPRNVQASALYPHAQRPPMSQVWNNTG